MNAPWYPCWSCNNTRWWRSPTHPSNPWICGVCHPPSVQAVWADKPLYGEDHED